MFIFVYGTTAEALKLSPIWRRLRQENIKFETWFTGQHVNEIKDGLHSIHEPMPEKYLTKGFFGQNMIKRWQALLWVPILFISLFINLLNKRNKIVIVHGDTISTLVGALSARTLHMKVAHVEAGLRSHNLRNPFPEEIIRILVGKLATFHFIPNNNALKNLHLENRLNSLNHVVTFGNTAIDNLTDFHFVKKVSESKDNFMIFLVHRSESIDNKIFIKELFEVFENLSQTIKIKIICDFRFSNAIKNHSNKFSKNIEIINKLPYFEFMKILLKSSFVVTDSGGLQEELAILGIPTMIHRKVTERPDGLNSNIKLSTGKVEEIFKFSKEYGTYRRTAISEFTSPSSAVLGVLKSWCTDE